MLLEKGKLAYFKDVGSHILILDPFIGQQCRRQITAQIHSSQPLDVQSRNGVVTVPKLLQFLVIEVLKCAQQNFRLPQEFR